MPVLRLSFSNLAEADGAIAYGSGQACNYCSTEAQQPQRPFRPWRSVDTQTTQEWLLDLGSSQTVALVGLVNAGFTSATIQGASSSGLFAAPTYSEAVALTCDPLSWRLQHAHLATGFGYRWLRIKLDPTTATCAGGPTLGSTYWELGGVWVAGALTDTPTHLRVPAGLRTVRPKLDVGPPHGGWSQRLRLGEPRVQIRGSVKACTDPASPGLGDALEDWQDVARRAWSADYFYTYLNLGDVRQGYVMRWGDDPDWQAAGAEAETMITLDEVVGP